jgi:hypothetical protein
MAFLTAYKALEKHYQLRQKTMAKVKKEPRVEVPEVQKEEAPSVPNKQDGTGKFVIANFGGEFFVFSPEGARLSGPLGEFQADDLAKRFQSFHK